MAGNSSPSPKARNTTILFITIFSLILILSYYLPLTKDTIKEHQAVEQRQEILVKELNIYYELWNVLTPDEQYVLFDLAKDGLVNTRNLPIIHRLYKKGMLTDNDNTLTPRFAFGNDHP